MKQQKWIYPALLLSACAAAAPVAIVRGVAVQAQQTYCLAGHPNEEDCSRFGVRLPQYSSAWLNHRVQQDVQDALGDAPSGKAMAGWASLLRNYARANTQRRADFISTQEVNVSIQPQGVDERWVAYTLTRYEYNKGAAHGSTAVLEKVWDVPAKRAVTVADMMVDEAAKARLYTLAYAAALAELMHNAGMSEAEARAQLDGEMFHFKLTDNWRPVKGGLVLVYQQYEIAPYAYGTPTLFIPVAQLRGVVKPAVLQHLQNWPQALDNSVAE